MTRTTSRVRRTLLLEGKNLETIILIRVCKIKRMRRNDKLEREVRATEYHATGKVELKLGYLRIADVR